MFILTGLDHLAYCMWITYCVMNTARLSLYCRMDHLLLIGIKRHKIKPSHCIAYSFFIAHLVKKDNKGILPSGTMDSEWLPLSGSPLSLSLCQ